MLCPNYARSYEFVFSRSSREVIDSMTADLRVEFTLAYIFKQASNDMGNSLSFNHLHRIRYLRPL